jgi:hypothetical protein
MQAMDDYVHGKIDWGTFVSRRGFKYDQIKIPFERDENKMIDSWKKAVGTA